MKRIEILDCTLRDGGYVNDWEFGEEAISSIIENLEKANVDIIELGFLREENHNKNRAVLVSGNQIEELLINRKNGIKYAAMAEMASFFSLEKICNRSDKTVDIIRTVFWKRKMDEGLQYCKDIMKKGYDVCIQPSRIEQYSKEEFIELIQKVNLLMPKALYIVDTFGLLNKEKLIEYVRLADERLNSTIKLGYHAHNNMQQALINAVTFIEMSIERDIMIDSSVNGIGKGAGNLFSEIIAYYINENTDENRHKKYEINFLYDICDGYISKIQRETNFGYNVGYLSSAINGCNPSYVEYLLKKGISFHDMDIIFRNMDMNDRIVFATNVVERYCNLLIQNQIK